ncbi:glycosyltransferase, partial [Enterococcus faecium]|uniref:glycosyltransferase n=1 Tax=Enterococcus faecium TaxID=1352 RepID=UPI003AAA7ACD
ELMKRRYDLVHVAMQQQPVFYFRPRVSTFHDLTLVYHDTTNANALVNRAFRLVTSVMFSITLRASRLVIVPSEATRRAVQAFAHIPTRKTVVTLEAADVTSRETEAYP